MATTFLDKWKLVQAIISDERLPMAARVVGAKLLDYLNNQTGQCSPSYATLGKAVGLSRGRVIEAVRALEQAGWVRVDRVQGGDSAAFHGYATNNFVFNLKRHTPVSETELGGSSDFGTGGSPENGTPPVSQTEPPGVLFPNGGSPECETGGSLGNDTQTYESTTQELNLVEVALRATARDDDPKPVELDRDSHDQSDAIDDNPDGAVATARNTSAKSSPTRAARTGDRAARRTLIDPSWQPDERDVEYAIGKGMNHEEIAGEAERFRDHHRNKQSKMVDWNAAWRTWVTSPYRKRPGAPNGQGTGRFGNRAGFVSFTEMALEGMGWDPERH